jgi:hypothetical protein
LSSKLHCSARIGPTRQDDCVRPCQGGKDAGEDARHDIELEMK